MACFVREVDGCEKRDGGGDDILTVGDDLGAALNEFRVALRGEMVKRAVVPGMALLNAALAVGGSELGGFAPVAGGAVRQGEPRRKLMVKPSEGRKLVPGRPEPAGVRNEDTPISAEDAPSYRVIMAQAKVQAGVGWARRQAERARLHMPVGAATEQGRSFAPPPGGVAGRMPEANVQPSGGGEVVGGGYFSEPGLAAMPVLRRAGSVHDAVAAAEAASGGAEIGPGAPQSRWGAGMEAAQGGVAPFDIRQALDDYFFRQSRLPPNGGAGFNPLLSPVWAGLKIPG